ncbi:alpha-N-acetylgalactosaminidase-like isoform X3 [Amphiura filiformis]|uniref:alpha-N-acetylgalactosaminidase-like isoform X3 n=1 Tax=Amphiura filiformis TaxID=82378 RepID=UPI003B213532
MWASAVLLVLLGSFGANALDNGLARTPPMGWLAWERFRCNVNCTADPKNCVSEKLFMEMADRLVEDGYKDAGYEYVNIDDCWMAKQRDANNKLYADPERFPSGIKGLADYMHKKGLKLGIYLDYGTKTCGGYPGSLDYLELDAKTIADWGVDMLKMDGCYADVKTMKTGYPQMTKYLNATGRPILFSCSWPDYERGAGIPINYTLVAENCNIWRNYVDIQDSWQSVLSIIDYYAKEQDTLVPVAGPGNFNDPDMLIIGDFSLSVEQAKAQMAMWAILAAPLLMSNDLRTITPEYRDILLNKDVIAISQDNAGIMGKRVLQHHANGIEAWTRPLSNGVFSIVFFSRSVKEPEFVTVVMKALAVSSDTSYEVTDVYAQKSMGVFKPTDSITVYVNPNGVVMLKATPQKVWKVENNMIVLN